MVAQSLGTVFQCDTRTFICNIGLSAVKLHSDKEQYTNLFVYSSYLYISLSSVLWIYILNQLNAVDLCNGPLSSALKCSYIIVYIGDILTIF